MARRIITPTLALCAIVIFFCEPLARGCEFDRLKIEGGQLWRLLTCHLAHWSASHLLWSGAVFLVIGAACEHRHRPATFLAILLAALAISLTAWLALPSVSLYRGLSGIDSALVVLLPLLMLKDDLGKFSRVAFLVVTYALFIAKVAFEIHAGQSLFVRSNDLFAPLPVAHLVGFAAGIAVGLATEIGNFKLEIPFGAGRDSMQRR